MTKLPFSKAYIEELAERFPTPFYIYDEAHIRTNARDLKTAMAKTGFGSFINFFAVKALPNPHILKVLKEERMGVDCSSPAELELAEMAGFEGDQIMFTSNNTTLTEFAQAHKLKAIINFDDLSLISPF